MKMEVRVYGADWDYKDIIETLVLEVSENQDDALKAAIEAVEEKYTVIESACEHKGSHILIAVDPLLGHQALRRALMEMSPEEEEAYDKLAERREKEEEEAKEAQWQFIITKGGQEFKCKVTAPELIPDLDGNLYAHGHAFGSFDDSGQPSTRPIKIVLED